MHAVLRCLKRRYMGNEEEHIREEKCTEEVVIVEMHFLKYSRSQGSIVCLVYSDETDTVI